jgi:hypothetical protein
VPWILQRFESGKGGATDIARKVKDVEIQLIDILSTSENPRPKGVIGSFARKALQRFPSSIYWNGLKVLRFITTQGTIFDHFRAVERRKNTKPVDFRNDDGEIIVGRSSLWHPKLPGSPQAFPEGARFALTRDEARFLKEQVVTHYPSSLFAYFLNREIAHSEVDFAWDVPATDYAQAPLKRQIRQARIFSEVMSGAAIIYNLGLARLDVPRPKVIDDCLALFHDWKQMIDSRQNALDDHDSEDFWRFTRECGASPSVPTMAFVDGWFALVTHPQKRAKLHEDQHARDLVFGRERQIKGAMARCDNRRVREMWQGEAGLGQMDYRWSNGRIYLSDIAAGLGTAAHA